MKIRIKGPSLRLRLSRPEVDQLVHDGLVREITPFPGAALEYLLRRDESIGEIAASFAEQRITVLVPAALTEGWDRDDRIGFEWNVPLGAGKSLFVLIEKDFQCLDNTAEDQSQNFPNPKSC